MPWEAAKLPWVNASLFGVQALLTCVGLYLGDAGAVRAQHDTPLTPANYAFSIWNVVYLLTMIMLVTDISYVGLSLYDSAVKPNVLRLCFAASCVANGAWCVAFGSGLVDVASVAVSVLWLTLLPLYVFASYERHVRPLVWHEYLCSEVCVRLYFAWVTVETLISWTITLQGRVGGFLELATYLVLLSVVVVLALCGIMYGRDPVLALVVVWALVGVTSKDASRLSGETAQELEMVQVAATLGAGVLVAMVVVSCCYWLAELYFTVEAPAKRPRRMSRLSGVSTRDEYGSIRALPSP